MSDERRLLLTHAHPDDESCATGGVIAKYVSEGALVTLVTCTKGEQGKIAVAELAHLAADRDDALGDRRASELCGAVSALGLVDHRYLGGEGHYRDSGRMGGPSNDRSDAFWQADIEVAGSEMAAIIRETRPHVTVTYDPNSGYGHPDHIQTHRVTMRALEIAADPHAKLLGKPWDVSKVYWSAVPRDLIQTELNALKAEEAAHPYMWIDTDISEYPDGVHDDAEITTEIDVTNFLAQKSAALASHATQLTVHGSYWVLASGRGMRIQDREWFILVKGDVAASSVEQNKENDLFSGLAGLIVAAV